MVLEQLLRPTLPTLMCAAAMFAALEWLVICLNRHYRIGAHINERSSHSVFTPTSGGVIWAIAAIAAAFIFGSTNNWTTWIFAGGVTALGIISVIDDIHTIHPIPRLIVQIAVMALSFAPLFGIDTIWIYLLVLFCGIGMINALNFLDGICGMLGLYGLVVSGTLLYALDTADIPQMAWLTNVIVYVIVAQVVFTIFNLRDTIFAGDAGAITLGYIQTFTALTVIIATGDITYAIFFAVCIFDTGLTTLQRLFTHGVSILTPHRMNIYQLLTAPRNAPNRKAPEKVSKVAEKPLKASGMPHLAVSSIYALTQLTINIAYFTIPTTYRLAYTLTVCALLTITYILLRHTLSPRPDN